jgi:hypothetical protein
MPDELAYTDLTVAVKENPDTGYAEIGPVVEGAFIPIGRVNLADMQASILQAGKDAADAADAKSGKSSSGK